MTIQAQMAPRIRLHGVALVLAAGRATDALLDARAPKRTGALVRSRQSSLGGSATTVTYTIAYTSPYAVHTDVGPRAHVIRARNARTLRFIGRDGRPVYRREVYWRPGPGVARNRGWFSKAFTPTSWAGLLTAAMRVVRT